MPFFKKAPGSPAASSNTTLADAAGVIDPEKQVKTTPTLDTVDEEQPEYLTGLRLYLVLAAMSLVVVLVSLDQTIVAAAIPTISDEFRALSDVGWYGSAYLLTGTAFQPVAGKIYTYFSLKWVFIVCMTIFEVGSIICATAQDSTTFIVGRAIAGVGFGGLYIGVLAISSAIVPVEKVAAVISGISSFYGIGASVGPIIGGAFTTRVSWRWCFWINLPIGGVALGIAILFLNMPPRKQQMAALERVKRLDWLGTAFLIGSVICLLLSLQDAGLKKPWSSSTVIGELVGFVVLMAAFGVTQYFEGDLASIVPRVLRQRNILLIFMANLAIGCVYFSLLYFLPIYFQAIKGSSAIRSAVETLPLILPLVAGIIVGGGYVDKTGSFNLPLLVGLALQTIGAGILTLFTPDTSMGKWIGFQIISGFGIGLAAMTPYLGSQIVLPAEDRPAGGVIAIFAQTIGATIFVSSSQSIYQNKLALGIAKIPGLDTASVLGSGVTAFRETVSEEFLPQVVEVASSALSKVFLCSAIVGAVGFVCAAGIEWKKLPKGEKVAPGGA